MDNFLIKHLENYAREKKDALILLNNMIEVDRITYEEILKKAKKLAKELINNGYRNSVAVVFLPATVDVAVILFACFYAEITPVFRTISNTLEKERFYYQLDELIKAIGHIDLILTDDDRLQLRENSIIRKINYYNLNNAKLNYKKHKVTKKKKLADLIIMTSGTTKSCKAVKINFNNLKHCLESCQKMWEVNENSITLSWAPHSHVLGLITGFLLPLFSGGKSIIMTPKDFANNPLSWIKMLSKYKITNCSTTLFGLEICSKLFSSSDLANIDLSSLRYIAVGGEIVKTEILNNFYKKYSNFGLKYNCYSPSYGMTENSGVVCSVTKQDSFITVGLNSEQLSSGKIVEDSTSNAVYITSVGSVNDKDIVYIVNEKNEVLEDGGLGEIIINSPGLTDGYITKQDNHSFIKFKCKDGKVRRFFKTGDLGGFYKGQLLITGRVKDIINLKGKKYSPYDIENIIIKDLPYNIKTVVAFSVEIENNEKIIVFEELIEEITDKSKICQDTINIIKLKMNIDIEEVVFISDKQIPRTDSKKIQRQKCKELYLNLYKRGE